MAPAALVLPAVLAKFAVTAIQQAHSVSMGSPAALVLPAVSATFAARVHCEAQGFIYLLYGGLESLDLAEY